MPGWQSGRAAHWPKRHSPRSWLPLPYLLEGLSYADLGHLAALVEAGAVDADRGLRLLGALLDLHPVPPGLVLDPTVGDLYNNRDAHLARLLGDDAGLVHLGRARREATTIAWQLAVRTRLLRLSGSLLGFADALLEQATAHRATIMPDYTYLQPAQPTTLAHYLLGFAYPVERDLQRAARALLPGQPQPGRLGKRQREPVRRRSRAASPSSSGSTGSSSTPATRCGPPTWPPRPSPW